MKFFLSIFIFCLAGCQSAPRTPSSPPPPVISTAKIVERVKNAAVKATEVQTKVVNSIRIVEKIIAQTDPATAQELQTVRAELLRIEVPMQELKTALAESIAETETVQLASDKAFAYTQELQLLAESNGEGWRKSEARGNKAVSKANRLQFWFAGIAGIAGFLLALHYVALISISYYIGMASAGIGWLLAWRFI